MLLPSVNAGIRQPLSVILYGRRICLTGGIVVMSRFGLAAVTLALVSFSSLAPAADLPGPAPIYTKAPVVAPVYDWSGFYVGGNAGYSWGHVNTALAIADAPLPNCHFCTGFPPAHSFTTDIAAVQNAGSPALDPNGFTGGGQFGYNWQSSHWVYGIELDFDAYRLSDTANTSALLPQLTQLPACTPTFGSCIASLSTSVSTEWLMTARPRVGYAWDKTLVYGTGGLAVTRLKFSQSYSDNVSPLTEGPGIESASASKTLVGWTVGAGVEQAIAAHWTVKAEYLYTSFGDFNAGGVLHDLSPGDFTNFSNSIGHLSSSTVRGGVNYRF
jgi:outer membrane immunogenic protein